ncbi:MAG: aldo/keto reductase, partial [Ignavibacteriota bacterium]
MPELPIIGFATSEGTATFKNLFPDLSAQFNVLGKTGLQCSPVGFGTYRCDVRVAEHRAALLKAIRMGVNLIDTSSNYANGNSEKMIGETIRSMISEDEITREQIIIVGKGGYIQGENYERISAKAGNEESDISPGSEFGELVRYSKGLWHSIHPDFLKDQLTRSLERLQLETIDVYLLHNPEYYIQAAVKEGIPEDEARDTYELRIIKAFTYLESEVEAGRIKWFGISSNTFVKSEDSIDRTSLEKIWKATQSSNGAANHFAVVQFPMNLYERGGLAEKNQEKSTKAVIDYAREHELGILVNRPLNAFSQNTLIRLADYPIREYPPIEEISELIHDLKLQEDEFKNGVLKDIALNPQAYDAVKKLLGVGEWLDGKWQHLASVDEWRDLLFTVIKPRIQYAFDLLQESMKTNQEVFTVVQDYAESIDVALEHITNYYTTKAAERSAAIHLSLDSVLPSGYEGLSLSQKAILMLRSIPGVSSVLVGMRSDEYVDDVMFGLQSKKLEDAEEIWGRLELRKA